ncbi:NTP transferase domain-containing protein [Oscillospiraceae bacterium CM]|nr:NTP transferase domain-containing protein [Oscillospiraceae bacterium CM]
MKIGLIILAAGNSERMGVLKPLLPIGGESAVLRCVALGRHQKIHSISVVTGYRREAVEAALLKCRAKNVRHIYNAKFEDGMFSSVKAGIRSLPSDLDGFFLLPADTCAVTEKTIEKLITAFILGNGESVVYPAYDGHRGHPPLIPYALAADIMGYAGADGLRACLAHYPAEEVDTDDRGVLLDMDTPQDYAALLRHLGLPTYPDDTACAQLLQKYETPDHIIAHGRQVEAVALNIARQLKPKGVALDAGLLSAACRLHDMVRLQPAHEDAAAALLLQEGYPNAATVVMAHMDLPDAYSGVPNEAAVLFLSDKLCRNSVVAPLEKTLEDVRKRYTEDPAALARAEKRLKTAMDIRDSLKVRYGIVLDALYS